MKTGEIIKGEDLKGKMLEVCEGGMFRLIEDTFPKVGDKIWYVDPYGLVNRYVWDGGKRDLVFAKCNRIFPTKELAQEYADYLKKKDELSFEPAWDYEEQRKFFFYYNHKDRDWNINCTIYCQEGQKLYFPNEYCLRELVDDIGEEKFLYFEFGISMSQEN